MYRLLSLFLVVLYSTLGASFLTNEEIDEYYKQGYFLKKGAFSEEEVREMDEKSSALLDRVMSELEKEIYPYLEEPQVIYIDGAQIVFLKREGHPLALKRVVGFESIVPSLRSVVRSKEMLDTYFSLLGTDQLEHVVCQFHPKVPGDGVTFVKHRDVRYRRQFDPKWEDVGGNGSYAACVVAIDPMSEENGGLIIDKKSYPTQNGSDLEAVNMEPGDILLMHPELLHWSGANHSTISRRVFLIGYCVYGANHKNYPGDCTNDVVTRDSYSIESAPWKTIGATHF